MVLEPSCELRRWFACYDGNVGRTAGAVGTVTATGWERTAGSEFQDCDYGNSGIDTSCNNNSICLDGQHACARETLYLCWRTERSSKSCSFVVLSFSAAVWPELRALMEKARTTAQVWSRQLYYMLSPSTSGEAQRRLQNVPKGSGCRGVEGVPGTVRAEDSHEVRRHAQADSRV